MFGRQTEESDSNNIMQKLVHNLLLSIVKSAPNIHEVGRFFSQEYFSHIHILTKSMCFLDLLHLKVHKKCSQERKQQ